MGPYVGSVGEREVVDHARRFCLALLRNIVTRIELSVQTWHESTVTNRLAKCTTPRTPRRTPRRRTTRAGSETRKKSFNSDDVASFATRSNYDFFMEQLHDMEIAEANAVGSARRYRHLSAFQVVSAHSILAIAHD